MQVAKWGNSLAVRIPVDVVRALGLKEGDEIDLRALDSGAVAVISERQRRAALMDRIQELSKPAPADFKFDREDANAR